MKSVPWVGLTLVLSVVGCSSGSVPASDDVVGEASDALDTLGEHCGIPGTLDTCDEGQYCAFRRYSCGEDDRHGRCKLLRDRDCSTAYRPVCGCDNVTYQNRCELDNAGASIRSRGECPPPTIDATAGAGTACQTLEASWESYNITPHHYRVYVNDVFMSTTTANSTTIIRSPDWDLFPGLDYSIEIAAVDAELNELARSAPILASANFCSNSPTTPTSFTATVQGCRETRLTFSGAITAVPGRYVYTHKILRDGILIPPQGDIGGNAYSNWGLEPSTTYTYEVRAMDNQRLTSVPTAPITVTTPACTDTTPPPAPSGLTLSPGDSCALSRTYTWSASQGARHYNIYIDGQFFKFVTSTAYNTERWLVPGTTYTYQVSAVDASGNESGLSNAMSVTPNCGLATTRNTAVILLNFPDFQGQPFMTSDAATKVFGSTNSLAAHLTENSYGQTTITGDAFGWYTMPKNLSEYCTISSDGRGFNCNSALGPDAENVAKSYIDTSPYDYFILVFQGVGAAGDSGGKYMRLSADAFSLPYLTHEWGHRYLNHAGSWTCTEGVGPNLLSPLEGGCTVDRYGDRFDPMGTGNSRHFSAYNKAVMGWITPAQTLTAHASGDFTLDALETPSSGAKELRIPLGQNGLFYTIDYRTNVGFDAGIASEGGYIRLHYHRQTISDIATVRLNSVLTTATPTFNDPHRGIQIDLVQKTPTQMTVHVTR